MSAFLARAPRRLRVVAALAVFLALATGATAQTETGRITGVVTDATGGILPGVTVTAKAVGTGATRELTTDSAGQYVFANLPPGAFEIAAALAGFNTANAKVTVTVGGAVSVDLKLDVAGTKENVNVVAEVPRINVTNSEVATTITETQIRELPTITGTSTTWSRSRATSRAARSPTARNGRPRRAAPATTSTASAPRAPTSCSTARPTTTSSTRRSARTSRSIPSRNSASSPATSRRSTAGPPAASSTC